MSDTAAKTPTKKVELPKIKGRASEVLAAEPKASLRQLAADNTNKKTFKNISGVLDRFVSYSRTPVDRTTDIEIQSVQAETTEALETTSLVLNLSTKHIDEQNKLLEDILKVIKIRSKKDESTGGRSILDDILDSLDGGKKAQKQRKYSGEREKKARQRLGQMRRQRMIRKLTSPFQRLTAPTISPPATSVVKPQVTSARPTVPEVTKPPIIVTPEPEAKKTYKTELDKNGKTRYRDTETGKFIKDPTKNNLVPEVAKPETLKPVAVAPEVTKIEPKIQGKDATKVTGQAAKKLSSLKIGGAVLSIIDGMSLMTDLDQIEHEYTIGEINKEQYKQRYGSTIGSFLGGAAGGAVLGSIGAAVGAPLLGVGGVIFGLIGGVAGTFAGSAIGSWVGETIAAELVGDTPPKPPAPNKMTKEQQKEIMGLLQDPKLRSSLDSNIVIALEILADSEQVDLSDATKARGAQAAFQRIIDDNKEAFAKAHKNLKQPEKPLSDAFRERYQQQETNPPPERQRRSSLSDGSYQVASAVPTVMSDAIYITDEPEIKLASDVKDTGEKIVDPTGKSASVINETVKDINEKQIQKATDSVDKLKTEVKKQNKAYETLNDVMTFFGIKRKVAEQSNDDTDTEDTPDTTPQVQATQNIQQLQSQVAQAPVSSGFSSGFSKMAGLAAGFMGATAAVASVGRPSRGGSSGANRIAAGSIGSMGGAAVMGAMMQPQNLGAFGGILAGGSTGMGQSTPQGRPSIAATGGAGATITGDDASIMAMVKEHEGYKTKPYKDSRGFWTVGVGHLIGATLPPEMNREFTMEEVDQLFAKDYAEHKQAAMQIPGFEKLNASGKGAVIDLTFNMGPAWYKKFPAASAALAKGDMETFANEMQNSAWYKQVGRRGPKIVAMLRGGGQDGSMQASQQNAPGAQLASASTSMEASDQAQMRGAGQALQGTTAPAPSTGPQGMQMPPSAMGMGEIPINIRLRQLQS